MQKAKKPSVRTVTKRAGGASGGVNVSAPCSGGPLVSGSSSGSNSNSSSRGGLRCHSSHKTPVRLAPIGGAAADGSPPAASALTSAGSSAAGDAFVTPTTFSRPPLVPSGNSLLFAGGAGGAAAAASVAAPRDSNPAAAGDGSSSSGGAAARGREVRGAAVQQLVLEEDVLAATAPAEALRAALNSPGTAAAYEGKVLTQELLRDWTGWEDLELVLSAELRIDAERLLGVNQMSRWLPRLTSLRLSRSHVPQVRLLGTRYENLKFLWLNNCHLSGLRGIGACAPQLRELYLAFNRIADAAPLMDLSATLEVLDLEGNCLADAGALQFVLPALSSVRTLTVQGNPFMHTADVQRLADESGLDLTDGGARPLPQPRRLGGADAGVTQLLLVRRWVHALMPNLQLLDDLTFTEDDDDEGETDGEAEGSGHASPGDDAAAQDAQPRSPLLQERPSLDAASAKQPGPLAKKRLLAGSSRRATAASSAASRRPGTASNLRSAYVDPTDAALAEELRLMQECLRDCRYDELDAAIDETTRAVYSRPSTSCPGARPRTGTARGGTAVVPGNAAGRLGGVDGAALLLAEGGAEAGRQLAATHGGHRHGSPSDSSALTTGGVFSGSAVASLRKRGGGAHHGGGSSNVSGASSPRGGGGLTDSPGSGAKSDAPAPRKGSPAAASSSSARHNADGSPLRLADAEEETGALFALTEGEEEWERYNQRLLLRLGQDREASPEVDAGAAASKAVPLYRQRYESLFGPDGAGDDDGSGSLRLSRDAEELDSSSIGLSSAPASSARCTRAASAATSRGRSAGTPLVAARPSSRCSLRPDASLSASDAALGSTAGGEGRGAAGGLDRELRKELARARNQIARAGRALPDVDVSDEIAAFLVKPEGFEVMDTFPEDIL